MNISTVTPAATLRHNRKSVLSTEPRRFFAVLAFSCLLLFTVPNGHAQTNNTINTMAGGVAFNPVPTQQAIPNPTGLAEDASGNIYIASQYSYYVYKLSPSTGVLSVFAGTGIFGFTGDGGPATMAALSAPVAVAVDNNSGNVYILDNNRIRVVKKDGTISTFANTKGIACQNPTAPPPACGDGGPAANAQFFSPQGLYVDGSGNLFIADTHDERIRFINTQSTTVIVEGITVAAGTVATLAGNGEICGRPNDPCGDTGPATVAKFDLPLGVATSSTGDLYIGDTRDQRIRCVANANQGCHSPNTKAGDIVPYAGSGKVCNTPTNNSCNSKNPLNATFHNPSGVWLDSTGNLYVADQWDNEIREVTTGSNPAVVTLCGNGTPGFGSGTCLTGIEFWGPLAFILDSAGNMTIADSGNGLIRQGPLATGVLTTIAGSGLVGDNGQATAASLANPVDVIWDPTGTNYYIVDNANNRIREVMANGLITTVAGNGHPSQPCYPNSPTCIGDGGPAVSATLSNPNGIAVDANGNLYIADSANAVVRVVNMQGSLLTVGLVEIQPGDIAIVAGQYNVGGCLPAKDPCGDDTPATGQQVFMDYPISVAVDGNGNVYTADYYDQRVRCVLNVLGGCPNSNYPDPQVGYIVTYAGTGAPNKYGDGGPADDAQLHSPYGIAADSGGDLYIADSGNNRVRCVIGVSLGCNGSGYSVGDIIPYAYNGDPTFTGDGGLAIDASRQNPQGLRLDSSGDLFVGGGPDVVVQRIDAPTKTVITVAGNPDYPANTGFGGDGGPATLATLDNLGLSVNPSQQLLIADHGNNRIRQVNMVPAAVLWERNLDFPNTPVGQTSAPLSGNPNGAPEGLQNIGLASLPISGTVKGGNDPQDFSIFANTCKTQLSPGLSCIVTVTFTPTQTGQRTAYVQINTSLGPQIVNLSGVGD
jgi:trimeric autotransporter adhesin